MSNPRRWRDIHPRGAAGSEKTYHVGVIGKSGTGKSSFINTYLRIPHSEDYAARTNYVECTKETKPYHLPDSPIVLWDVPGYDTQSFPYGEAYLKKVNFNRYDFYLHISSTKLGETEIAIHNEIGKQGKRYFYIRTKIDCDLKNQRKAHPRTFNEETEKNKIRKQIESSFPDVPVFLVNCMEIEGHDFPTLREIVVHGAQFSCASHKDVQKQEKQAKLKPIRKQD